MRLRFFMFQVVLAVAGLISANAHPQSSSAPQWQAGVPSRDNSRALAMALGAQLKARLTQTMSEQGAVAAISVCRDEAPRIAAELSRLSGAKVGRTSQRFRNPLNAPEPWQAQVLSGDFDEFYDHDDEGARYMRAIRLGGLCATCHGQNITPQVKSALAEHYPHDLATGYAVGELRGAFVVSWPNRP